MLPMMSEIFTIQDRDIGNSVNVAARQILIDYSKANVISIYYII